MQSRTEGAVIQAILGLLLIFFAQVAPASATFDAPLQPDEAFKISLARQSETTVEISWTIADGYYLYRDRIAAQSTDKSPLPLVTEVGTIKDDPNFGPSEVYYRQAIATLEQANGDEVEVTYQGCQEDGICYAPETRVINLATLEIDNPAEQMAPRIEWTSERSAAPETFQLAADENLVGSLLSQSGTPAMLAMFLLFGILLAFTPCVFPMYPIVAATLAREGEALTAGRGFKLTLAYVVGLASAFALVGATAGWSGQNLQMYLQSIWMTGLIASVFVVLALSMFGLFELRLPTSVTSWLAANTGNANGSVSSASALGFASALIVGPCVTAPLAGALLYIASTGDTFIGAAALFALGLGKGVPLIVMGTIGGQILPRAGAWMERLKIAFAILFLGAAVWLASPLLPPGLDLALYAILFLGTASTLFWSKFSTPNVEILARTAAMICFVWGVALTVGAASGSTNPFRPLSALVSDATATSAAKELTFTNVASGNELQSALATEGRSTLVYFTADWCVTCRTIERSVLPDAAVQSALQGLHLVKVDVTDFDRDDAELMGSLRVAGPPTMIFFDTNGREVEATRLAGTINVGTIIQSATRATGAVQ